MKRIALILTTICSLSYNLMADGGTPGIVGLTLPTTGVIDLHRHLMDKVNSNFSVIASTLQKSLLTAANTHYTTGTDFTQFKSDVAGSTLAITNRADNAAISTTALKGDINGVAVSTNAFKGDINGIANSTANIISRADQNAISTTTLSLIASNTNYLRGNNGKVIYSTHIVDGAISSLNIEDGGIVSADIGTGQVTAVNILDDTIGTLDIAEGGIFWRNIGERNVGGSKIAIATITYNEIKANTIQGANISSATTISVASMTVYGTITSSSGFVGQGNLLSNTIGLDDNGTVRGFARALKVTGAGNGGISITGDTATLTMLDTTGGGGGGINSVTIVIGTSSTGLNNGVNIASNTQYAFTTAISSLSDTGGTVEVRRGTYTFLSLLEIPKGINVHMEKGAIIENDGNYNIISVSGSLTGFPTFRPKNNWSGHQFVRVNSFGYAENILFDQGNCTPATNNTTPQGLVVLAGLYPVVNGYSIYPDMQFWGSKGRNMVLVWQDSFFGKAERLNIVSNNAALNFLAELSTFPVMQFYYIQVSTPDNCFITGVSHPNFSVLGGLFRFGTVAGNNNNATATPFFNMANSSASSIMNTDFVCGVGGGGGGYRSIGDNGAGGGEWNTGVVANCRFLGYGAGMGSGSTDGLNITAKTRGLYFHGNSGYGGATFVTDTGATSFIKRDNFYNGVVLAEN